MNPIEFEGLTEDDKNQLISSGIEFMRSITNIAGTEKGMELWDKLTETLGNDIKGAMLFTMLNGGGIGDVHLSQIPPDQFVATIKCVRTYTGLGLKEAKDLCDVGRTPGCTARIKPAHSRDRHKLVIDLKRLGCNAY